jgi:putative addiction module component (TIGR02574 family)
MNIADIKKMSTTERLQTMEAIWDSLLYEDGEIESPYWHEKILEKRKAKIKSGKAKFISLSELKTSRKK